VPVESTNATTVSVPQGNGGMVTFNAVRHVKKTK